MSNIPSKQQIEYRLKQGHSYAESIDNVERNVEEFDKYANFKMITKERNTMSNKKKDNRLSPEEINKETFRWRMKDRELTLDEMDLDFKFTALAHALRKANENFSKRNYHSKKTEIFHRNTEYFMSLCEVLEDSLMEDHNLNQVPSTIEDIKAMQRMIKDGTITGNFVQEAKSDTSEEVSDEEE